MSAHDPIFILAIGLVALLYAAVGHGGASGYLALLAFTTIPASGASALALVMNLAVSATSFASFRRYKHFDFDLAWPFLIGSVPAAYLGGLLKPHDSIHQWVLGAVLFASAMVLIFGYGAAKEPKSPPIAARIAVGAGIGLVSGMVGVGGGIFLSPILVLAGWADAKRTAAVAALFIFANSFAGLIARASSVPVLVLGNWVLIAVGTLGALLGAWYGASKLPNPGLRRLLGFVLLIAVAAYLMKSK